VKHIPPKNDDEYAESAAEQAVKKKYFYKYNGLFKYICFCEYVEEE
jgi:hypothetical protein